VGSAGKVLEAVTRESEKAQGGGPERCIWLKRNRTADPRGRKKDFPDAERLVKRLVARELILSFVPDASSVCGGR